MRQRLRWWTCGIAAAGLAIGIAVWAWRAKPPAWDEAETVARLPRLSPDYSGITLPPNIAPANFAVREEGSRFAVRMRGDAGETLAIESRSPAIEIPLHSWRRLLEANRGKTMRWEVYVEADGTWRRYQPVENRVAEEAIDGHLVYRLIGPVHNEWREVAVEQRRLDTYERSTVLDGAALGDGCVNCHSFCANGAAKMLIGVRSASLGGAALLAENGRVRKVDAPFGYTAWHPSGRLAAYSTAKVRQFFHETGAAVRDVVDIESSLACFEVDSGQVRRVPGASNERQLATYPAWSPDGRYLYYCRAPMLWTDRDAVPPKDYDKVRYDLMRIPYRIESDAWGVPETVLSADATGLSILLPRVSPDGRFVLFCMCRYGCFPAFQASSDLYLMDLTDRSYTKLAINSDAAESWHCWSKNGRWIAFSSKRASGQFTRCYLSHFDGVGGFSKPFLVPQEDPGFYDALLKTISVPELLESPVSVSRDALAEAARGNEGVIAAPSQGGAARADTSDPYLHAGP